MRPYIPSFGACTDVSGRQQQHLSGSVQPLVPVPDGTAPPRALQHSHWTRPRYRRAFLWVTEFRRGLCNFLWPFTPPLLACQPPWSLVVISSIADSMVCQCKGNLHMIAFKPDMGTQFGHLFYLNKTGMLCIGWKCTMSHHQWWMIFWQYYRYVQLNHLTCYVQNSGL